MSEQGQHISVKDWSQSDQPREKLECYGAQVLSEAELLAILLRTGSRQNNVLDCCKMLLSKADNNLNTLANMSLAELSKYEGIGRVKAITILAAIELGKRRAMQEWETHKTISSSTDAFAYLKPLLCDLDHEEVWILLLNNQNQIISKKKIGQGGLVATVADLRLIMRFALEAQATSIILAHNHPSGNCKPSNEDVNLTRKVNDACHLMDIKLVDHIIVARNNKFSFIDEGML